MMGGRERAIVKIPRIFQEDRSGCKGLEQGCIVAINASWMSRTADFGSGLCGEPCESMDAACLWYVYRMYVGKRRTECCVSPVFGFSFRLSEGLFLEGLGGSCRYR